MSRGRPLCATRTRSELLDSATLPNLPIRRTSKRASDAPLQPVGELVRQVKAIVEAAKAVGASPVDAVAGNEITLARNPIGSENRRHFDRNSNTCTHHVAMRHVPELVSSE